MSEPTPGTKSYRFKVMDADWAPLDVPGLIDIPDAIPTINFDQHILCIQGDVTISKETTNRIKDHLRDVHGGKEWLVLLLPENVSIVELEPI